MKKLLTIVSIVAVSLAFAAPVAAATPDAPGGPPESYTGLISFSEIIGGIPISVVGWGSYTGHIVKLDTPGNNPATEESWFKVTDFSGSIFIGPFETPYTITSARVKITVHAGTQGKQPVITLRSSVPIAVPAPYNAIYGLFGTYRVIQMVDGAIIHAN
jgi:hypothetical protein